MLQGSHVVTIGRIVLLSGCRCHLGSHDSCGALLNRCGVPVCLTGQQPTMSIHLTQTLVRACVHACVRAPTISMQACMLQQTSALLFNCLVVRSPCASNNVQHHPPHSPPHRPPAELAQPSWSQCSDQPLSSEQQITSAHVMSLHRHAPSPFPRSPSPSHLQ